jgi:hypothetical protein
MTSWSQGRSGWPLFDPNCALLSARAFVTIETHILNLSCYYLYCQLLACSVKWPLKALPPLPRQPNRWRPCAARCCNTIEPSSRYVFVMACSPLWPVKACI